ncbi:disintegrin and metalloproteinase domain-containing protein 33 [Bombina bombina]|uniref:disintegrin and metalloproteinase domain-containing protein 33 n=1 Tax=Bombina bombina TaxID=8345 RepID=UPI00235AB595|nr:disintegrin and metalloproteinase domain-containing protein 33 [Bombina bombina]
MGDRGWNIQWSGTCTLLLALLTLPAPAPVHGAPHGEAVTAVWLQNGRIRRSLGPLEKVTPARGEILVTTKGQQLVLEVERNQHLLAPGYSETHYTADGKMVTVSPNHTDHCYYHGEVRGHQESWVTLSTCSGIRGVIVLNTNDSYYLTPLAVPGHRTHMMYRTEQLNITGGSCEHEGHYAGRTSHLSEFISQGDHHRMKRNVWGAQKYMELFIVADHTLYINQKMNLGLTKQRIMDIANYVSKFYLPMNIKVALIGLEVWTDRDHSEVTYDANRSLYSFLEWQQKQRSRKKHDNAQLVTGKTFNGPTIGMAPLESMCTDKNSGGISMDHSEPAIGAAATMAHELGHNLGMSHDSDGCCVEATAEQGGCIMAAATGHPFPRKFSSCSKQQLNRYFQKGGGMCLFDMPNTKDLVMGKKCGNGFQEEGEECDCGEIEECTNPCCNASTCTLKPGAQCAHGECCEDCKLKSAGTLCRETSGSCDLPEFCRGDAPHCPLNVYMLDGSPCAYGEAYCYNGMCLSHEQQCIDLWGSGARPAPDICFQDVNKAGDTYGNCGKDANLQYVKCNLQDAKCGKIQCQSSASKPKGANMVPMDTTIRVDGYEVKCRGTFSYSTQKEEGDSSDPGLVMTGTKCGDGMVCWERSCQNASFFELDQCFSKCNGHGVCNSNRNCHCEYGWSPPFCDTTGQGGSVDSGPMIDSFPAGLVVFLLLLFMVFLPVATFVIYYCSRKPGSNLNKWLRKSQAKCGMCKGSQQKSSRVHSNTIFTLRSFSSPARPSNTQNGSKTVFQGKSGGVQNGSQPVNIVRPLRPAPSPVHQHSKQLKPSRPPPPAKSTPPNPKKVGNTYAKLLPPKKPLPSCPAVTSQLNPPRKPLPGNPPHKEPLLVMTPATNCKPPVTNAATQLKGPHRPIPGGKVQAAAAAFLQKK